MIPKDTGRDRTGPVFLLLFLKKSSSPSSSSLILAAKLVVRGESVDLTVELKLSLGEMSIEACLARGRGL